MSICANRARAKMSLGVKCDKSLFADAMLGKKTPKAVTMSRIITLWKSRIDIIILELECSAGARMTALQVRDHIRNVLFPEKVIKNTDTFRQRFHKYINECRTAGTRGLYEHTLVQIDKFNIARGAAAEMTYDDVSYEWLTAFNEWLTADGRMMTNSAAIHFRNIRAVINSGIMHDETTHYPFRKFKIRHERTRKRSVEVEELREILACQCEPYAEIYRDMFALIFMLIGINTADLHALKEVTSSGRIEYIRRKTGTPYSIKVEPEAMAIIEKYKGVSGLLSIADRWQDHRNFRHSINKALQRMGAPRIGRGGKKGEGKWPFLTTYWARHTWASIAADLDIPDATIANALGHADATVTDIYIKRNTRKVDEANRKVLDWVLYGKR